MKFNKLFVALSLVVSVTILVLILKKKPLPEGWIGGSFRRPSIGQPSPRERSIFFLETSCAIRDQTAGNGLVLPPRVACALESAAAAHPDRPVYFVHTCSLDVEDVLQGNAPSHARAALALPNVFLWPVRFRALFLNSPLEQLVERAFHERHKWLAGQASQLLRYFLLWKYGGTFLDTDVLILKSFGDLRDFTSSEAEGQVSGGAMDFSWDEPGRLLAETCLEATALNQLENSSTSGHEAISSALKAVCGTSKISSMDAEKCHGFRLLSASYFYPVPHEKWFLIFDDEFSEITMEAIGNSYGIRTWNAQSKDVKVKVTSQLAYAQIAWRVCPAVISNVKGFI